MSRYCTVRYRGLPMLLPATPVRYTAKLEQPEDHESETSQGLQAALSDIMSTTQLDYGHGVRSVHAKSHALLEGNFEIIPDLHPLLAQGVFATARSHRAILRLSTIPGDLLEDSVSVPRGLAVKLIDVKGERLPGSEADTTQDFVFGNGPTFAAAKASQFLSNLKLLSNTTDRAEWAKKALSSVLRRVEGAIETFGGKSPLLRTLGGQPLTHPAGDKYYSQTAFRFGDYVAKFQIVPVSANLSSITDKKIDLAGRPDAWREEMTTLFAGEPAVWDFRVQLLTDLDKMPVEDASVAWPEELSPYITVAKIIVGRQLAWSPARAAVGDDQLAFSPWHGIAEHRPLGVINRVRKPAYKMSADSRSAFNGCPIHEPRGAFALPH